MSVLDKHLQDIQTSGELVLIFREHTEGSSARLCRINVISSFAVYATNFNDDGNSDSVSFGGLTRPVNTAVRRFLLKTKWQDCSFEN